MQEEVLLFLLPLLHFFFAGHDSAYHPPEAIRLKNFD